MRAESHSLPRVALCLNTMYVCMYVRIQKRLSVTQRTYAHIHAHVCIRAYIGSEIRQH